MKSRCGKGLHNLDDPANTLRRSDRRCLPCRREYNRTYRAANLKHLRAAARAWHLVNGRAAYLATASHRRVAARRYLAEHPGWAAINNRKKDARRRGRDPHPDLTAAQWAALLQASRGRCQYCLKVMAPNEITVDHVEPNKNGGSLTLPNVVPACNSCNRGAGGKFAKTVEQWLPTYRAVAFRRRHAKLLARVQKELR